MKRLLFIAFLITICFKGFGTKQQNDIIIYNGETCELNLDWYFPSPFQCYYDQHPELKYPFRMLHTANYRGHIATWEIKDNVLFLIKITREQKNIKLKTLFKDKAINGKVKADWFSGYLLVLSGPFKEWYDSPYSDGKFYVIDYKKYIIVKIENGSVVNAAEYETDQYWDLNKKLNKKQRIAPQDSIILNGYFQYTSSFLPKDTTEKEVKYYTEKDFKIFITRYWEDTIVNVPLTEYCIIKNLTFDENAIGYFNENSFILCDTMNVLLLEMGASNVPHGPWDDFAGGAVLLVIKVKKFLNDTINVGRLEPYEYKSVNNFARYKSPKNIAGNIIINPLNDTSVCFNGVVEFTSTDPNTRQEILFENAAIPVYTVMQYLEKNKDADEFFPYKPDEKYKEIEERTKVYYQKKQ